MTEADKLIFKDTCKQAYELVRSFQNNSQSWGPISKRLLKADYKFNKEVRIGVQGKVEKSLQVLDNLLDHYLFHEIAILYNGGKDCLVMLILLLASVYKKYYQNENGGDNGNLAANCKLDAVYVNSEIPFPELSQFIETSANQYHLKYVEFKDSLQNGFATYLSQNPRIRAIIVGIRYSDPYGSSLQYEQMTDGDWPRFLRIHPILHWNYVDIWDFLLGCDISYCSMYDHGYTSLGGIHTTLPNPYLQIGNSSEYYPAYMLVDDADARERLGRVKKGEIKESKILNGQSIESKDTVDVQ